VYWKQINGRYYGCNDGMAELFNLDNRHAVVEHDDIELFGEEPSQQYIMNDRQVINSQQSIITIEAYKNSKKTG